MAPRPEHTPVHDTELAHRIREILSAEDGRCTEKAMFGGLAFLCNGNMAVAALGPDRKALPQGIMIRCPREDTAALLERDGVEPMIMSRGPVKGWVRLPAEQIATSRQLSTWLRRGWRHALTLPAK